jgi:hypothetical protein
MDHGLQRAKRRRLHADPAVGERAPNQGARVAREIPHVAVPVKRDAVDVCDDGAAAAVAQHELVLGERRVHVVPQRAELAVEEESREDGRIGRRDGRSKVRTVGDRDGVERDR